MKHISQILPRALAELLPEPPAIPEPKPEPKPRPIRRGPTAAEIEYRRTHHMNVAGRS